MEEREQPLAAISPWLSCANRFTILEWGAKRGEFKKEENTSERIIEIISNAKS